MEEPPMNAGNARLTLAVFGKHPGWDDHIPGLGVETEWLAEVKQSIYVTGIGRQIDTGAWERLEEQKRLDGFDHVFLWLRPRQLLLGLMWSSKDGKGRAKYPMMVCVEAEAVSACFLLTRVLPELERLRQACKAAQSAEQVMADCRQAQIRLNSLAASPDRWMQGHTTLKDIRRRFVEARELGPDRVGLLRSLHELERTWTASAPGRGLLTEETAGKSSHLRLPLAAEPPSNALLLWNAFLRGAIPVPFPEIIFILRSGSPWFDVIVGEPSADDFFCLQASPQALPLATDIPYEISPQLKERLQEIERAFLGLDAAAPSAGGASVPPSNAPRVAKPDARPGRRGFGKWLIIGVAIPLVLAAAWWFSRNGTGAKTGNESAEAQATAPPSGPPKLQSHDDDYRRAIEAGQAALSRTDYLAASRLAGEALTFKSNDAAATQLKQQAEDRLRELAGHSEQQKNYQEAIDAAKTAFAQGDFSRTLALTGKALAIKPDDATAAELQRQAAAESNRLATAAAAAQQRRSDYESAMSAAQAAFDRGDFTAALTQATAALRIQTNDPAADRLRVEAQNRLAAAQAAAAEQQRNYDQAVSAARAAMSRQDYVEALAKADAALAIKKNDPPALAIRQEADRRRQDSAAAANRDATYRTALDLGNAAFSQGRYQDALAQAQRAYDASNGAKAAVDLKNRAAEAVDLQEAQSCFNHGQYDQAMKLCAAHPGNESFSRLSRQIDEKTGSNLDGTYETLLVLFGVLEPKDAKTPEGQKARRVDGEIGLNRDQYLKWANELELRYAAMGLLTAERQKNFKALKKSIDDHL